MNEQSVSIEHRIEKARRRERRAREALTRLKRTATMLERRKLNKLRKLAGSAFISWAEADEKFREVACRWMQKFVSDPADSDLLRGSILEKVNEPNDPT